MKPYYEPCGFAPHCLRARNHPGICGPFFAEHELTLINRHHRAYGDDFLDIDGYGDANNQPDAQPALGSSFMEHPRCLRRRGTWTFDFVCKLLALVLVDEWDDGIPTLHVFFEQDGTLYPKGRGALPNGVPSSRFVGDVDVTLTVEARGMTPFRLGGAVLAATIFDTTLWPGGRGFDVTPRFNPPPHAEKP